MSLSSIEWTDRTWNPARGCSRVSEGCRNCYAETFAARNMPGHRSPTTGEAFARRTPAGPRWTGKVELITSKLDEPLHWRKPQRVFVNSMSDLFHESLSDEAIAAVFGVMAAAPAHTFQILTKRPARMREWFAAWARVQETVGACPPAECMAWAESEMEGELPTNRGLGENTPQYEVPAWPLPNVWLGVSVEDQATADERIPLLLQTPAAVRFVSYEPALGPVDFARYVRPAQTVHLRLDVGGAIRNRSFDGLTADDGRPLSRREAEDQLRLLLHQGVRFVPFDGCTDFDAETGCRGHREPRLDWIIVGGESGPGARPFDVAWARSTVEQCKAAGVAVFVKQMGAWVRGDEAGFLVDRWACSDLLRGDYVQVPGAHDRSRPVTAIAFKLLDSKGGNPSEWPADLRVREMPT